MKTHRDEIIAGNFPRPVLCEHQWKDGWGEHQCMKVQEHQGHHRCRCE